MEEGSDFLLPDCPTGGTFVHFFKACFDLNGDCVFICLPFAILVRMDWSLRLVLLGLEWLS